MKQTHHIGYVQTPSVKNLSNVKNALVENGLVPLTTPNEMLPDAIEKGLKALEFKDFGMIHEGKYRIRYFDIDGTILKIEYVAEGGKLTPPAKTPNYDPDYLIFDEWNYDIENYVVEQPTDVGAIYKTVDDASYMFVRLTKGTNGTGLKLQLKVSDFTSIDWGDGTVDTNVSHTYESDGSYIIKIIGKHRFNTGTNIYLLGTAPTRAALFKIYFGNTYRVSSYMFSDFNSLECVSLSNYLDDIASGNNFEKTFQLKHLTIPRREKLDKIPDYAFNNTGLQTISIPESVKSFGVQVFKSSYIKDFIKGKNVQYLTTRMFYVSKLQNAYLNANLYSPVIDDSFDGNYCLKNIFIVGNKNPVNANINAFDNIPESTIFWISDEQVENYKNQYGYTTYASQMKPLSWYPSLTDPNAE